MEVPLSDDEDIAALLDRVMRKLESKMVVRAVLCTHWIPYGLASGF